MKLLHSIFFYSIVKSWMIVILIQLILSLNIKFQITAFLGTNVEFLICTFSVIAIFSAQVNIQFYSFVNHFVNRFVNRQQLLTYYISYNLLSIPLFYISTFLGIKWHSNSNDEYNSFVYFMPVFGIACGIYISICADNYKNFSNRKKQITFTMGEKFQAISYFLKHFFINHWKTIVFLLPMTVLFILSPSNSITSWFAIIFFCIWLCCIEAHVEIFKINKNFQYFKFSGMFFILFYASIGGAYIFIIRAIDNPKLSYNDRLFYRTVCSIFCEKIPKEELENYWSSVTNYSDASDLASLLKESYKPSEYLYLVKNQNALRGTVDVVREQQFSEEELSKIVKQLSVNYKEINGNFLDNQESSMSIFTHQKVSESFIYEINQNGEEYEKLVALVLAGRNFSKEKFIEFYKDNQNNHSENIKKSRFVERNVASDKRN